MENRASYTLVGAFVLAVILAGAAFAVWLARYELKEERTFYYIYFRGSVAGLSLGGRAADRDVGKAWILQGFAIQALAMTLHFAATHHALPAGLPSQLLVALAIFVAATALFSITPVIQSRLIQATEGAPVALALNGSVISVGQALGSAAGGASLATWGVPAIPATALALSLTAFAILSVAFPRKAGA